MIRFIKGFANGLILIYRILLIFFVMMIAAIYEPPVLNQIAGGGAGQFSITLACFSIVTITILLLLELIYWESPIMMRLEKWAESK